VCLRSRFAQAPAQPPSYNTPSGNYAFFLIRRPVRAMFLDRTGTQDRVRASGWPENIGERWEKPSTSPRTPERTHFQSVVSLELLGWEHEKVRRQPRPVGIGTHLEKNRRTRGLAGVELLRRHGSPLQCWKG
jgi:hypothetical protein